MNHPLVKPTRENTSKASRQDHSAREVDYLTAMIIMNDLIDNEMPRLKPSEFKLAMVICRKTIGWGRFSENIGTVELCGRASLDPKTVKTTIRSVCELLGIRINQTRDERTGVLTRRRFTWPINERVASLLDKARAGVGGNLPPTPEGQRSPEGGGKSTPDGGGQNPPTQSNPSQSDPPQSDPLGNGIQEKTDSDNLPTNRKNRDSHADSSLAPSQCKPYPDLREAIARYMATDPQHPAPEDFPTDRRVVEVIQAAGGASETEVVKCLRYLYDERGLRPGTTSGPRSFAWFPKVVRDDFDRRRTREDTAEPCSPAAKGAGMPDEEICRRSSAFDPVSGNDE
jgi:hypothetical protein